MARERKPLENVASHLSRLRVRYVRLLDARQNSLARTRQLDQQIEELQVVLKRSKLPGLSK